MKEKLFAFLLIAICLLPLTIADGGMFVPPDYGEVYAPSQKAAIFWDGTTETMILSTKISVDNLTNLAWVVPIPSKIKPEVDKGDIQIFYELKNLFNPKKQSYNWDFYWGSISASAMAPTGVQVIETKKVDIYDITILKATNASVLVNWLNENGYTTPETAVPVLQDYCDRNNFYFIANKINLANKYENLTITKADIECASKILPEESYSNKIEYYQSFFVCSEGYDLETVKILLELKQGISTPLKFTFQPEEPFYPMKISSINEGDTEVKVYFFSEIPVEDKKEVLSTEKMTTLTNHWKDKYNLTNEKYITLLTYNGALKDLKEDSYFASTKYKLELDPNYVSLSEGILNIVLPILNFLWMLAPFVIIGFIFITPFFIIGYLIENGSRKIKNKYLYYLPLILSLLLSLSLTTTTPRRFRMLIMSGLLTGFYAAYKNSRKWVWMSILLILICLFVLDAIFFSYYFPEYFF